MAASLSRTKSVKPTDARVEKLRVLHTNRISRGMVRITFEADDADDFRFTASGHDQWVRLFLPGTNGELALPLGDSEGWYSRWLSMPETDRPTVRNYTIREARHETSAWHIDIDFVVHRSAASGEVEGAGANWALAAVPGTRAGMLDQGVIFAPGDTRGRMLLVSDESGLPGIEGILRALPSSARAAVVVDVQHADDRRELTSAADIDVTWLIRDEADAHALAGQAILAQLDASSFDSEGYVYAVGEASFVLEVRARAKASGVPKHNVDFCAYWRMAKPRKLLGLFR